MIGLDTNVLLRALLPDQQAEGVKARKLVAEHHADRQTAFINHVVLCELAWVLTRTYRYSRQQVDDAVATILATPAFVIPEPDQVEEALQIFRTSSLDFADALIGVLNRRTGCTTTYTFDRAAAATPDFTTVA